MIDRFVILEPGAPRPDAERIIFCDGAGGRLFRESTDLDLSHWRPNRTPRAYRADTSTEICFRFLDAPAIGPWSVAANNHLDVDGMLSIYTLVHSRDALAHRESIIAAAEMGDFWSWGEPAAQRLFQGLTLLMNARSQAGVSTRDIYAEAFDRVTGLIDGTDAAAAAIEDSLAPLRQGVALVESGAIRRTPLRPRFTQYVLPAALTRGSEQRAVYVPAFNEAISANAILWPQARARWDGERVSLVTSEVAAGWLHDLWFPGYLWADIENRWTVPGMRYRDGMERYDLDNPKLSAAVAALRQRETAVGTWASGSAESPFHRELQSSFPVVLRFVDERGQPAASRLDPDQVAGAIADAFE